MSVRRAPNKNGQRMGLAVTNLLCFLLILGEIHGVCCHTCSHKVPQSHEVVHHVHLEPMHVMKKRSISQELRIHLVYDESVSALPLDHQRLIREDLIPSAVYYWEDTLRVRYTSGPIKLLRQCQSESLLYQDSNPYPYCVDGCKTTTQCGETRVPPAHLEACREARKGSGFTVVGKSGTGVPNADFILYVSAYATDRCNIGTTVAYAAYCQLEGSMDRPVAGNVNLCPDAISVRAHDLNQMHSVIKHEILHALGFSAGLFAFYRNATGEPLTERLPSTGLPPFNETAQVYQWSEKVIRKVTRPWKVNSGYVNRTVHMIVTSKVVEEVRRHFNCTQLEGAELEDQGVQGTTLTHWEKRIFENEGMTGTYTQNPLISRVTLALMEDTGWYKVDYRNAEQLKWGRNLGCDFVTKSCLHWMEIRSSRGEHIHPYCNRVKKGVLETECTEERDAVALCNLVEYPEELPLQYQHFTQIPNVADKDVRKYGGNVVLADFCPYIQEFHWKKDNVIIRGSRCDIPQNNAEDQHNYMLEHYGNQSTCFDHQSTWKLKQCSTVHQMEHWGSGCYKYTCSSQYGLTIHVKDRHYQCYREGQIQPVRQVTHSWLHEGTIVCPSCSEICQRHGVACPKELDPPMRSQVVVKPPCNLATTLHQITVAMVTCLVILSSSYARDCTH